MIKSLTNGQRNGRIPNNRNNPAPRSLITSLANSRAIPGKLNQVAAMEYVNTALKQLHQLNVANNNMLNILKQKLMRNSVKNIPKSQTVRKNKAPTVIVLNVDKSNLNSAVNSISNINQRMFPHSLPNQIQTFYPNIQMAALQNNPSQRTFMMPQQPSVNAPPAIHTTPQTQGNLPNQKAAKTSNQPLIVKAANTVNSPASPVKTTSDNLKAENQVVIPASSGAPPPDSGNTGVTNTVNIQPKPVDSPAKVTVPPQQVNSPPKPVNSPSKLVTIPPKEVTSAPDNANSLANQVKTQPAPSNTKASNPVNTNPPKVTSSSTNSKTTQSSHTQSPQNKPKQTGTSKSPIKSQGQKQFDLFPKIDFRHPMNATEIEKVMRLSYIMDHLQGDH